MIPPVELQIERHNTQHLGQGQKKTNRTRFTWVFTETRYHSRINDIFCQTQHNEFKQNNHGYLTNTTAC
jgi:hypothetical protein